MPGILLFSAGVVVSLAGLGPRSGSGMLVAAWYAGLTVLALALAFRGRGLHREPLAPRAVRLNEEKRAAAVQGPFGVVNAGCLAWMPGSGAGWREVS